MTNHGRKYKLVILDRDGVINRDSDDYIKSPQEWIPLERSLQAIARLNAAGYRVAIATNQSGIARGYYDEATLYEMHDKMKRLLAAVNGHVDLIRHCPHGPDDGCACRKPAPGMLLDILQHFPVKKEEVVFVGDTLSDYRAAQNAGIAFVLVKSGKGERLVASGEAGLLNTPVFEDLMDFTTQVLT